MNTQSLPPGDGEETSAARANRNWSELTQELRVTQTGAQILTAFLLLLPFQPRFASLTAFQEHLYLGLISCGLLTIVLMVAPVTLHRILFQRGRKPEIVAAASRFTIVALVSLGVLFSGTVSLVFSVVLGGLATWIAPLIAALIITTLWLIVPWRVRRPLLSDTG